MSRRALLLSPALLLSFVGAGCSGGGAYERSDGSYQACVQAEIDARSGAFTRREAPQGPFSAALLERAPAELASLVRAELTEGMRSSVEAARAARIAAIRCDHLRPPREEGADYATGAPSPESAGEGGAREVSGTNNQVAGVDEADFIKNDDKFIYVASGATFRIIDAWPAEQMHEIASVPVPGEAKKLFVEGNRALVYSSVTREKRLAPGAGAQALMSSPAPVGEPGGSGECTYGYDGCVPSGDGTATEISIFDISDRTQPRLVRSLRSSSSLIAARRIGNAVHTVLGEPSIAEGVGWQTHPSDLPSEPTEAELDAAYDALIAKNAGALEALAIDDVLPNWEDSAGSAPNMTLFQSSMPDGAALTSVLSIDLTTDAEAKVASVFSRPGWVYASASSLYMAVPHQQRAGWGWYEGQSDAELSTIHKFSIGLAPGATAYASSGIVKGRVLNQLALDERDGFLRVATTTSRAPSPDAHSTISVLEERSGKLELAAKIDEIAKTEDIRSVRFDGDRGYIVTFKKTDPLFVFDLSNPRAPKTMGELKIPGFSTYMHMMDATHLLTIGYDAADQGDFAYFTGVLLQIFDVSDPANPRLAHKETIGTRGTSSEALTNHLAFNYFAPKNALAIPMTVCEGGGDGGSFGTEMTFSGLMVYDTTTAAGFSLRGKVAHPNTSIADEQNGYGYDDLGCSNWWTNASSEVKRSIFMDDWVFSVSDKRIKANHLDALSTDVAEVSLQ